MGSQPTSVCASGWEEPHKARHVCVSEVRRGICESVAGVAWRVRGERGHMGRQRGWWVWWPRRSHTHSSVGGTTVGGCAWCHHTLTHSGQGGAAHTVVVVGGKGAQWWWQPHHTHSHHHHVPITPCVCESGVDSTSTASEWTKWPHTPQHPRCHHHIHHQQQQQQEEEWCGVGHKEWVDV